MQPIVVPTTDGRTLKAYRFDDDVFAVCSDLDAAFGMSRPGMRGMLSKNGIKTVVHDGLKQSLGVSGKVHFLNRQGLEKLFRLRLSDSKEAIEMLTPNSPSSGETHLDQEEAASRLSGLMFSSPAQM